MNSYSVDFEEGEIREYAPAPILSSIATDWDHQRYARDASRYFDRDDDGDDDDSIRSSRPCTPPSQSMSVPGAPGPKTTLSRVATTPPSPSPPPQCTGRWGGASTATSNLNTSASAMDASPTRSVASGRDATRSARATRPTTRWTIPPDVYQKAESALARITSMSRSRSSAHSTTPDRGQPPSAVGPPTHRYSPEQGAPGPTPGYSSNNYSYASSAFLDKHREPPRSPRKSLSFFFFS